MLRLIAILVLLSWGIVNANPVDPLAAARFYERYYALYKTSGPSWDGLMVRSPAWFKSFCADAKIPVHCNKLFYAGEDIEKILKQFRDAHYYSNQGGLVEIALLAAQRHPNRMFQILFDLLQSYPMELDFDRVEKAVSEKQRWQELLHELPVVATETVNLKGIDFSVHFLSNGRSFAMHIQDPSGRTIYTDGPRWVLQKSHPERATLNTSMTTTWADPKYRGYGLYQYSLNFYLKVAGVKKSRLYTENEETLEFTYRMKQLVFEPSLRAQLLQIDGMSEYLESLGVDLNKFARGIRKELRKAENLLGFLSLQGRTRLSMGMDFVSDSRYPAIVYSQSLDQEVINKIKIAMKALEENFQHQTNSAIEEAPVWILPKSYLQKFRKAPDDCSNLLMSKAS